MTDDMAKLKCKKKHLVDKVKGLLLEHAEMCEALGSERRQKGDEIGAKIEFEYAARARRIKSNLSSQLLGIDISNLNKNIR